MRATKSVRKTPHPGRDWHPAEVVAAVRMAGTSLRQLSIENDLGEHTLKDCLRRSYPRAEAIVAAAIGKLPAEIWPSRYMQREKRARAAA